MTLEDKAFEDIVGKGKNAGNLHFVLFSQCFLPSHRHIIILSTLICCLQMFSKLVRSKICCLVKSLPLEKNPDFEQP